MYHAGSTLRFYRVIEAREKDDLILQICCGLWQWKHFFILVILPLLSRNVESIYTLEVVF
jgi:hypothetical protein